MPNRCVVYILAGVPGPALYIGLARDLHGRLQQHRWLAGLGLTGRYRADRLVHVEQYSHAIEARAREKQLKTWSRARLCALIESANPGWHEFGHAEILAALAQAEAEPGSP